MRKCYWSFLAVVLLLLLGSGFGISLYAEPITSVGYSLYHYEGGTWVRYSSSEGLPAGGNVYPNNLWRYNYRVKNFGYSSGINTIYVYYNSDNVLRSTYDNVYCVPTACWTFLKTGPAAGYNNWKVRFRTTTSSCYIAMNDSLGALTMNGLPCDGHFAVQFRWTGEKLPGPQNYDAISGAGSEASVTIEGPIPPTLLDVGTWGRMKALYK